MDIKNIKTMLLYTLIVLGVYLGLKYVLPIVLPFVIAYLIACIMRPITDFLTNKLKIQRIISASISLILLLVIFSISIYYLSKMLISQLKELIKNMPLLFESIAKNMDSFCSRIDKIFELDKGMINQYLNNHLYNIKDHISYSTIPKLAENSVSLFIKILAFFGVLLIIIIASLLIVKDMSLYGEKYRKSKIYKKIHHVTENLRKVAFNYLKAQGIIALIISAICFISLLILKNKFSLIIGISIGIIDAFPILGSGLILVPWSIVMLLQGDVFAAALLMTTFLICQIIRQVLEAKLLGDGVGINSIFMLMSIYIGIKLFSIAGFILGPIGLIIIVTIFKTIRENINLT